MSARTDPAVREIRENAPANLVCELTGERVRCFVVRRVGMYLPPRFLIEAEGVQCIVSRAELEVW